MNNQTLFFCIRYYLFFQFSVKMVVLRRLREGTGLVKRKFIRTRSLQSGMKIDQAIVDGTGRTLIARGTFLDEYMIDALLNRGVGGVYTIEGEEEPEEKKEASAS